MAFRINMTGTVQVDDSVVKEYDAEFRVALAEQGVGSQFASKKVEMGGVSISMPTVDQSVLIILEKISWRISMGIYGLQQAGSFLVSEKKIVWIPLFLWLKISPPISVISGPLLKIPPGHCGLLPREKVCSG